MPVYSEDADVPVGSPRDRVSVGGRARRTARNQAVFREVSEQIAGLTDLLGETGCNVFICECSDPARSRPLEVPGA